MLAILFVACNKEENLSPSKGERNWLVVEDSDDSIDHLRFQIFEEFGIPVYYNDTIGSEQRESIAGSYTYYERLQAFYNPGGSSLNGRFTLVEDKNKLQPVLQFLREEMLPMIPKTFYIPSLLLVDSLYVPEIATAYKGLNTVVCAKGNDFLEMDAEEMKWWRGAVMCSVLSGGLLEQESEWLEKYFYAKSVAVDTRTIMYSTSSKKRYVYQALGQLTNDKVITVEEQCLGLCGFLNHKHDPAKKEREAFVPTHEEDVQQFCETIFAMTLEEFEERWGKFPVVMAKYEAMKGKLKKYGFTFE